MAGKPFYLHTRGKIWYVRLRNPQTGKTLSAISTRQKDRDQALLTAATWLREGIPKPDGEKTLTFNQVLTVDSVMEALKHADLSAKDAQKAMEIFRKRGLLTSAKGIGHKTLVGELQALYDFENSTYVKEKLAHGQGISRRHCYDATRKVITYYKDHFGSRIVDSITRRDLKDFSLKLQGQGLSPASINKIMNVSKTFFGWAKREELIAQNPADGLSQFSGTAAKRDILTDDEYQAIFAEAWPDKRSMVANMLAATTGMRAGEVIATRLEDIGEDRLFLRHSWSPQDGLTSPKNGEERTVPLLPQIRYALRSLAQENPWNDGFVFYSTKPNQPMDGKMILSAFVSALHAIGITEEQRRTRNLVFHSWRHRFAAKMADKVDARALGLSTGHKTQAMLEHYANHANETHFQAVLEASKAVFGTHTPTEEPHESQ